MLFPYATVDFRRVPKKQILQKLNGYYIGICKKHMIFCRTNMPEIDRSLGTFATKKMRWEQIGYHIGIFKKTCFFHQKNMCFCWILYRNFDNFFLRFFWPFFWFFALCSTIDETLWIAHSRLYYRGILFKFQQNWLDLLRFLMIFVKIVEEIWWDPMRWCDKIRCDETS